MGYTKPLPQIDRINKGFWDAARRHELALQMCEPCGKYWYPPSAVCPHCQSPNVTWKKASGLGRIWSRCRFHHLYDKAFAQDIPYNVVMVELDEGPMFIANVAGVPWESITIGMRVRAVFTDVTDEVSLLHFVPDGSGA